MINLRGLAYLVYSCSSGGRQNTGLLVCCAPSLAFNAKGFTIASIVVVRAMFLQACFESLRECLKRRALRLGIGWTLDSSRFALQLSFMKPVRDHCIDVSGTVWRFGARAHLQVKITAMTVNATIDGKPLGNLGPVVWGKIRIGRNESGSRLVHVDCRTGRLKYSLVA